MTPPESANRRSSKSGAPPTTGGGVSHTPPTVIEAVTRLVEGDFGPGEFHYLDYHAHRFAETLAHIPPGEGRTALDVGAYPGHLTLLLADHGYQMTALTGPSEPEKSLAKVKGRFDKREIRLLFADIERDLWPIEEGSFDLVVATEVIEHLVYNPYHLLAQAFRALKPGGSLLVTTPNIAQLEKRIALWRGGSVHMDIAKKFYETYSSILSHRHIREFSADELRYLFERQNKESYRFEKTKVSYTWCFDEPPGKGSRLARMAKKIWPPFRGNMVATTTKPSNLTALGPNTSAVTFSGFHEEERFADDQQGGSRLFPPPYRWSGPEATLTVPATYAPYQLVTFNVINFSPFETKEVEVAVNGHSLGLVTLTKDDGFTPLCVVVTPDLASDGRFAFTFTTESWRPEGDRRDLGIVFAWDALLREDLASLADLKKSARRELGRGQPLYREWWGEPHPLWSSIAPLFLLWYPQAANMKMNPDSWDQLGGGFWPLERVGDRYARWTSGRSELYLQTRDKDTKIALEVDTGERQLGERVEGHLEISWSEERVIFSEPVTSSFSLPAEQREVIEAALPPEAAGKLCRIAIVTRGERIPAKVIEGSGDHRFLGLMLHTARSH